MPRNAAVLAIYVAVAIISTAAQTPDQALADSSSHIAWDVISVRPNHSVQSTAVMGWAGDGIQMRNMSLRIVLLNAFAVISENQITGYPAWANSDRFDIQAKMDTETANAYNNLSGIQRTQQSQSLVRQILVDRFGMKYHTEMRELSVFFLVTAKHGVKIKDASPEESASSMMNSGKLSFHKSKVGSLAFSLSGTVGRVIIDETSLTGLYDIELTWSADNEPDSGPSIFAALQDQLGLKLEPGKAPIDVIVIDHLERPTEN